MIRLQNDDPRWAEFVATTNSLVSHHPAWMKLMTRCYGYRTFVLAIMDDGGQVTAGLPVAEVQSPVGRRRWVALPFTHLSPPLASNHVSLTKLSSELQAVTEGAGVSSLEIHGRMEGPGIHSWSAAVIHRMDLQNDSQSVFRTFDSSTRRAISASQRRGAEVKRARTPLELTETFYHLHLRTRRRLGIPVQPRRYFGLLWDRIVAPGLGFLLLAYVGDTPVAGSVFLIWNRRITYAYSASDPAFGRHRPTNLILWMAVQWGCEHGFRELDLGRSDFEDEGLRNFKNGWGTKEQSLEYSIMGRPPRTGSGRLGPRSRGLIRSSPVWVCRTMGELLYKYAA